MSSQEIELPPPGRRVRLVPAPPGLTLLLLGVAIAALSPLLGFLIGSGAGSGDGDVTLLPIYWGLLGGVVVGGGGVLLAVLGGLRLWRHVRPKEADVDA